MSKPKVLIQIDLDKHASSFDSLVAIDCGIDHLLTHSQVDEGELTSLIHGAMFTRGIDDLKNTALFFGGSNVAQTESLGRSRGKDFFRANASFVYE